MVCHLFLSRGMILDVTTLLNRRNNFPSQVLSFELFKIFKLFDKGENLEVIALHHFFDEQAYDFDTFVIGLKTKVYPCDPHILWTQSGELF